MNKNPKKNIIGNNPTKVTIKPKIKLLSKNSFSSIKSFQTETKSLNKSNILNSSSNKKNGKSNFQQVNSTLGRVKNSIVFLNKKVKSVGEKAEIQNDKLEEIKKEQLETKKAIIILKEQQKKTNQKLKELKVEQVKTNTSINELKVEQVKTNNSLNVLRAEQVKANNSLNELRAEQAKTTDSVNITNKLLTELLNLKRDKLKNNNQNAITIPQNSSEQIKSVIEINETPRYINILKKPEEKSDEISFRSIINNLEISDANAKKKNI